MPKHGKAIPNATYLYKDIDIARENDPDWILSNKQVGGVCYVDLFAGNLQGLKAKIPYFQELGLTYCT